MDDAANREIFDAEFQPWLPKRVFDAHIHIFKRDCYPADYVPKPKSYYTLLPNESYTIEDCKADVAKMLPGRDFYGLCFGSPTLEVNRDAANQYIASISDNDRVFGLAIVSPEDSVERVESWISSTRLLGYKPYRNFVTGKPREAVSIPDMLTAPQMKFADDVGLFVVLHIPRVGRLAAPDNQREIIELADAYPNAIICIAHVGRAFYVNNVLGQLDEIAKRPNLYVDIAMLNHWEVMAHAFEVMPRERILFGTDLPISRFGGKSVEINNGYAYIMETDFEIGSAIYDAKHVVQFTYFYYEELRAIRKAADAAGVSEQEIEAIFFGNAMGLMKRVIGNKAKAGC